MTKGLLLVWAVTGSFELIAALAGDLQLREDAHNRLGPSRLRYGVFDAGLCVVVRDGRDRVDVAREYLSEPPSTIAMMFTLAETVEMRLAHEEEDKAAATAALQTGTQTSLAPGAEAESGLAGEQDTP